MIKWFGEKLQRSCLESPDTYGISPRPVMKMMGISMLALASSCCKSSPLSPDRCTAIRKIDRKHKRNHLKDQKKTKKRLELPQANP
jgi:hypothetical protein